MLVSHSCGTSERLPILSLGRTPLPNALLTRDQLTHSEATLPLDLVFCQRCTLLQLTERVSPEKLFRDYFLSFSDTLKPGRFTRGTKLPIYAPENLLETQPDSVLLLTWNSADEVSKPQAEYRERGGKFIIPLSQLEMDGIR